MMSRYQNFSAISSLLYALFLFLALRCDAHVINKQNDPAASKDGWGCGEEVDRALLRIIVKNQSLFDPDIRSLDVKYQNKMCINCQYQILKSINYSKDAEAQITLDSYYEYNFMVSYIDKNTNSTVNFCDRFDYNDFGECGEYLLEIGSTNECSVFKVKDPVDSNKHLYTALVVCIVLFIISNLIERLNLVTKLTNALNKLGAVVSERGNAEKAAAQEIERLKPNNEESNKQPNDQKAVTQKKAKSRLHSLDTFRGLSLIMMIVTSYGGGGYKILNHIPWNGLTVISLVFPWFIWIMGVSIVLSINILLRKGEKRKFDVFVKIVVRSLKMFVIGVMLNSRFGTRLDELRVLGVLQRISICYIVVATVELVCYKKIDKNHDTTESKRWTYYVMDLVLPWKQWIVMSIIFISWFLITYLLDVPGCGRGYLGPGGLDSDGKYPNCTGGATGYLDSFILGPKMKHPNPTHKELFQPEDLYEPEGFLSSFNAIILTFLGVQTGRILVLYQSHKVRLIKWSFWAIVNFGLFFILTQDDMHNGLIPVNKNLWTPPFTFFTAGTAVSLLTVFYILIDLKKLWSGNPFIYPGMNSILIYSFHYIFRAYLPVYWIVSNTHGAQLAMTIWGTIFWILVSMYLYRKRIFVNL